MVILFSYSIRLYKLNNILGTLVYQVLVQLKTSFKTPNQSFLTTQQYMHYHAEVRVTVW